MKRLDSSTLELLRPRPGFTRALAPGVRVDLQRRRADHLPAVAPPDLVGLVSVDLSRRTRQQLLEELPSRRRRVEEQHPAVFHACATPRGMKAQAPGPP